MGQLVPNHFTSRRGFCDGRCPKFVPWGDEKGTSLSGITAFALQKEPAGSIMARCLELGERRWVGIVTMSAKKLGLEPTLRPVGRPRKPTAKKRRT